MLKTVVIKFKSGRVSKYPDCAYFEYLPKYDKWAVGSFYFKSHEKLFDNSKIAEIYFE